MEKIDILSLSYEELEQKILDMGEKKFRAKQIFEWLHIKKVLNFSEMTNISKAMCIKLEDVFCIKRLNFARKLESSIDNTVKYLYELPDGHFVESVLMDYSYGTSICVSTQAGCKMGCKFCASAIAGYVRDLSPSEILLQVYESAVESKRHISNIVLMGIGEPLDNFENVIKFLKLVSDKRGNNLSLRHITLSTCGIVPRIYELANLKLPVTLSVSLHCPYDKGRSEIMPVNRKWGLSELIPACREYVAVTGRRITFEYAVIENVNSSKNDAYQLASILKGLNCHINLIPVNAVKETNFSSSRKCVENFQKNLTAMGLNATVRRTLGADINAACGQLRRESGDTAEVRL